MRLTFSGVSLLFVSSDEKNDPVTSQSQAQDWFDLPSDDPDESSTADEQETDGQTPRVKKAKKPRKTRSNSGGYKPVILGGLGALGAVIVLAGTALYFTSAKSPDEPEPAAVVESSAPATSEETPQPTPSPTPTTTPSPTPVLAAPAPIAGFCTEGTRSDGDPATSEGAVTHLQYAFYVTRNTSAVIDSYAPGVAVDPEAIQRALDETPVGTAHCLNFLGSNTPGVLDVDLIVRTPAGEETVYPQQYEMVTDGQVYRVKALRVRQ